jgi:hypothetical protein
MEVQLALLKSLEMAGYRPTVLLDRSDPAGLLAGYYAIAGIPTCLIKDFAFQAESYLAEAREVLLGARSFGDVIERTFHGIGAGTIALSSTIRQLGSRSTRLTALDLGQKADRNLVERRLAKSILATVCAERVLEELRPDLVVFGGTEYTPTAELFELCLRKEVSAVVYDVAHRSSRLMLKRYTSSNKGDPCASLSSETWEMLKRLEWTDEVQRAIDDELRAGYATGDWYGACWTQSGKHPEDAARLKARWGLDPQRKTAVIFSHVLWDAPLSWAKPLFPTFESWLAASVGAACRNPKLNWVVKIHPASMAKEGHSTGEPAEVRLIRERIGPLPRNVVILPAESDISTDSVLAITDYCVTVRGTVGIEAARLGIPVLTSATARYSHRGFTIDSESVEEYVQALASLDQIPPLNEEQRQLANRFAYGLFVLRPLTMTSVTWQYGSFAQKPRTQVHVRDPREWAERNDIQALAAWFGSSTQEDFLTWPRTV